MVQTRSRLTPLQADLLEAFFQHEDRFYLTGAEEILANKLCALLGRAEIRDLVDVRALEGLGLSLTEDGGLTPAQLAWVLSQITIGEDTDLPGAVGPAELRKYLDGLVDRLARLAHP